MSVYNRRTYRGNEEVIDVVNARLSYTQALDPELYNVIMKESHRQVENIELIASENFASTTVLEVAGSILTDKYAEGYPGKRYYGGCEYVDMVENLACFRAKELFQADYANVQPHSGSNANMAAYKALLQPGDSILGMDLAQGGHLTHGSAVNFSGQIYNAHSYGVSPETGLIDYDEVQKLAEKHRPKLIIAGASSYPRILDFQRFRKIADSVEAFLVADMAHIAGLVAAGLHPSPVPHAHITTSTTHKTLRGPRGGFILVGKDGENSLGIQTKSGRVKKWCEVLDSAVMPGVQGGPLMHIVAAKAVAFREALLPNFIIYQQQVVKNAQVLSTFFQEAGIKLVTGGSDNHLMILNLTDIGLNGKDAETMLDEAHITVNKNVIPFEPLSPLVCSGIRIGTAAVTSRGMRDDDIRQVGSFIVEVLQSKGDKAVIARVGKQVKEFTSPFPRHQRNS